ncbi:hypothetical protein HOD05_04280 [Candidatus Woesearchaeota archaeon]|jgi:hypothetical protein|nr:hypothetical protein [Candidatus Woesearchaeota archaeon]MBT4150731.1 hypothetical protein [Candidatus Woesearchaeota archaeon]MBT4247517.1 hypothetical protein [Candidatus Woesearchaeota archaeon]MBT4434412.1 hypothetical protein [Candidatus Woesearchaeota archaeon]MBT7331919.1 hypothetical protein [Candidatus Woesearchaeota archaeon]
MKFFNKRGGISLGVNLIVVLIISIVVLGLGIAFIFNLMDSADKFTGDIDQRTEDELSRILIGQGRKVALHPSAVQLTRGNDESLGVGIMNLLEDDTEFTTEIEFSAAQDETGKQLILDSFDEWFNYFKDPLSIKNQAHESVLIVLEPPKDAISGKYIFNVRVYVGTVQYGNTQKLEVNLK